MHDPAVACIAKSKAGKKQQSQCRIAPPRLLAAQHHELLGDPYDGHNHEDHEIIPIDKRKYEETPKHLWRWMKCCAAIEPTIGQLKNEHRFDRNRLKGTSGHAIDAQKRQGFFWLFYGICSICSAHPRASAVPLKISSSSPP